MSALIAAGALAKAWLVTLGLMAAQGSVLALGALALGRAGKLRPGWQAALWLVVVGKLALPWSPALPWSLSDLVALLTARGGDAPAPALPPALQPLPPAPHLAPALAWLALAVIWLGGAAFVLRRAVRVHCFARRAALAAPLAPPAARALLAELAARVGVRPPRLAIGEATVGPHVVGAFAPIIVVPPALLEDETLLRAALLHELAHVRRRDALGRVVQTLAAALCFWWPIARLASRRLDRAREEACDAWALEAGDVARPIYARLLLRMAALREAAAPSLAARHALAPRIAAVLGPPARARLGGAHRLVLAVWIALALGGARTAAAHGERAVCKYTPQLAASLYASYPEADLDGDGMLSRDEACELQAELRRHADELVSRLDPAAGAELQTLLSEPLCCNCERAGGNLPGSASPEPASCQQVEGVSR